MYVLGSCFFAIGPVAADFDPHVEKTIGTTDTVEETSVENAISGEGSIDEIDNAEMNICAHRGTDWTRRVPN